MNRAIDGRGLITNGAKGSHQAYEHAIATYALAELYQMNKGYGRSIPRLHSLLSKAGSIIIKHQSPEYLLRMPNFK